MFKALQGRAPIYILERLRFYSPQRSLRSSAQLLLNVPKCRLKTKGDRSFSVYAPKRWNTLPLTIRASSTLSLFKASIKTDLFSQVYSFLCISSMLEVAVYWDIAGYDFFWLLYIYIFILLLRFRIEYFWFCFICVHFALLVKHFCQHSVCFKVLYKYILTLTLIYTNMQTFGVKMVLFVFMLTKAAYIWSRLK